MFRVILVVFEEIIAQNIIETPTTIFSQPYAFLKSAFKYVLQFILKYIIEGGAIIILKSGVKRFPHVAILVGEQAALFDKENHQIGHIHGTGL